MDGLKIIESLDSLWLFSNVFSSRTQPLVFASHDDDKSAIDQNQSKDTPKSETSKHMTPIFQSQQTQFPNSSDIVVQRFPKCGDLAVEVEQEEEERRRSRSRRRFKRNGTLGDRRKINVREFDLGFDVNNIGGSWMMEERASGSGSGSGYERFGSDQHHVKMPPFRDGMAMKQHLKSWAHAVACTVR